MLTVGTAIGMLTLITAIVAGCSEWVVGGAWGRGVGTTQQATCSRYGGGSGLCMDGGRGVHKARCGAVSWWQGGAPAAAGTAGEPRPVGRSARRVARCQAGRAQQQQRHKIKPGAGEAL